MPRAFGNMVALTDDGAFGNMVAKTDDTAFGNEVAKTDALHHWATCTSAFLFPIANR